jgi:hypothetical protein
MIEFRIVRKFNCEPQRVWSIVKDVNLIPKYWKGIRELEIKKVNENIYEGYAKFAFPSTAKVRITIYESERKIIMEFLEGVIQGYNIIRVNENLIESYWKVNLKPILRIFEAWNKKHFYEGTKNAIERILSDCRC